MRDDDPTILLPPVTFTAPPPQHTLRRVAVAWLWALAFAALASASAALLLLVWAVYRVA